MNIGIIGNRSSFGKYFPKNIFKRQVSWINPKSWEKQLASNHYDWIVVLCPTTLADAIDFVIAIRNLSQARIMIIHDFSISLFLLKNWFREIACLKLAETNGGVETETMTRIILQKPHITTLKEVM